MTHQPWTPSEDERLRKLAAEGRTSATIAERLKRSRHSVRQRALRLKIVLVKAKEKRRTLKLADDDPHNQTRSSATDGQF